MAKAEPPRERGIPGSLLATSEPKLLFHQYLVERVVGEMGNCVLVKLRHARHGRRFVLKYLAPGASTGPLAVEQFLGAARRAMRLHSEHAARTVDAGLLPGRVPFLITEAFQGAELRDILRVRKALGLTEAVDTALQAIHAVAEAHRQGIVHGSLSPSTLFVTPGADGVPTIKVLDFGSSTSLRGDPLTLRLRNWTQGTAAFWESTRLWDTLAYSAPEQLRGSSELTPAVDVWALGAILYEALTGSPPFRAPSTTALMATIVADSPRTPTLLRKDLHPRLEAVILRCLAKEPDARFRSVAELAAALRAFSSPEAHFTVERIGRIQDYDPRQASLSSPSHAIIAARGTSMEHFDGAPRARQVGARSATRRRVGAVLLAMLGAVAGAALGTLAARTVAPYAAAVSPASR